MLGRWRAAEEKASANHSQEVIISCHLIDAVFYNLKLT